MQMLDRWRNGPIGRCRAPAEPAGRCRCSARVRGRGRGGDSAHPREIAGVAVREHLRTRRDKRGARSCSRTAATRSPGRLLGTRRSAAGPGLRPPPPRARARRDREGVVAGGDRRAGALKLRAPWRSPRKPARRHGPPRATRRRGPARLGLRLGSAPPISFVDPKRLRHQRRAPRRRRPSRRPRRAARVRRRCRPGAGAGARVGGQPAIYAQRFDGGVLAHGAEHVATRQAIASRAARATCPGPAPALNPAITPRESGRHHGAPRPASAGSTRTPPASSTLSAAPPAPADRPRGRDRARATRVAPRR